jgi:RHS repeat-associated protein
MGFSVDANGNVVASSIGGQSDALGYDALDRLTSSSFGTFSYDANGNRLSDSSGWYNYESQSNRLITTPAGSVVLDAAGETLNQPGLTLSYNAFGQLASSSNGSASTIYSYRFDGQRSSKTSGATTTLYHYDTLGRLIAESNEAGIFLVEYFWDDQDRPLAQFSGASKTFLHFDHLGTPRIGTSATGAVVWTWASPAFGNSIPTGSATVNLRLPGQYFDSETGLHQNRFRSYNAVTGRYVQSDPIGVRGGINSFGYVGGNPGRFVDPRGLDASIVLYPGAIVFGHVGIAVNSAQTIGFYPALGTSEINVALGAPNKGEWRLDTRTPIERITIPLSHAQDQVLIDYLSNADRFPGSYQLGSKNCATSVEGALRAVGLNPPNSLRPSGLMNYLRSLYY